MTAAIPGDQARVSVTVPVEPGAAFRIFTEEIDQWWRHGVAYRVAAKGAGTIRLEAGVGGRFFEAIETRAGFREVARGLVTAWEPPARFVLEWRAPNFAPSEKTEVEVTFEASPAGTLVTVTHRGWSQVRADHPSRHGLDVAEFIRMTGMWWGDLMTSMRHHAAAPRSG